MCAGDTGLEDCLESELELAEFSIFLMFKFWIIWFWIWAEGDRYSWLLVFC